MHAVQIAVIDDDHETRELMQCALELEGYRAVLFSGSEHIVSQLEAISPDLILLDVMIAGRDGYEICYQIKQSHTLRQTPVLFVSGISPQEAEPKVRAAGANDYLSKPFLLKSLYQKIQKLLKAKA